MSSHPAHPQAAPRRAPIVLSVVGARPQFIKAAMLSRALARVGIPEVLVHTGQHYDQNLSDVFFTELQIPQPKYNLEAGSGSHAKQTAIMLEGLERVFDEIQPDVTIVYGDTNSTLAGAVASAKRMIPVVHVEAGMRSFDRYQPEEINRVVADHLSELLLCVMPSAVTHLSREGITTGVVHVGDLMFDATRAMGASRDMSATLSEHGLTKGEYVLVTVHRPESTDREHALSAIVHALIALRDTVVFPLHPRTRAALIQHGLFDRLTRAPHIIMLEPVAYGTMLDLEANARVILTDSGGVQKEAYFLGVPCVNPRDRTEWHELVDAGWQVTCNYDEACIHQAILNAKPGAHAVEGFGNGDAADHAARSIKAFLDARANSSGAAR